MQQQDARWSNEGSASATWRWKRVMVSRGAAGSKTAGRKAVRWRHRTRRDPAEPIGVRLKWRGGAEAYVLVTARGESNVYPGYATIADVLLDINNAR